MIWHDLIYCILVCIGNALDHICLQMCYRAWWNLTWKNGVKSRSRRLWLLMYDMLWCMAETASTLQASLEYSPMLNAKYDSYRISKIETELTFRNLSFIYIMDTSYIYECFKAGYGVPKNRQICSRDIERWYFQGFQLFLLWNCGDCHIFQGASNKRSTAQHLHRLELLASLALSDSSSWKRRRWRREKHVPWSSSATAICIHLQKENR